MMFPRLENAQVKNRRALVLSDFNTENNDLSVIRAKLRAQFPTYDMLLGKGASLIIASHVHARKSGEEDHPGLEHLAPVLEEELKLPVTFIAHPTQASGKKELASLPAGGVALLENLMRFPAEVKKDHKFAEILANHADLFVSDSFFAARHDYASSSLLPTLLPSYAGVQLQRDVDTIHSLMDGKHKPIVWILGGVRLDRKLKLIRQVLNNPMARPANILVGGGIAYTFLKSRANPIGSSLFQSDLEVESFQVIERSQLSDCEIQLPSDHLAAEEFSRNVRLKTKSTADLTGRWMGLDIGPKTVSRYEKILKKAGLIFWWGPLGSIELEGAGKGTLSIAKTLSRMGDRTIVAGEDLIGFLEKHNLSGKMMHQLVDSQSSLSLLFGEKLPGLEALLNQE